MRIGQPFGSIGYNGIDAIAGVSTGGPDGPYLIDDFEGGDLYDNYSFSAPEHLVEDGARVTEDVYDAPPQLSQTHQLELEATSYGPTFAVSSPGDGLDYYPQKGDRISVWTGVGSNFDGTYFYGDHQTRTLLFGVSSESTENFGENISEAYAATYSAKSSDFRLKIQKKSDGSWDPLDISEPTDNGTTYDPEWRKLVAEWGDPIKFYALDVQGDVVGSVEFSDSEFDNNRGVGLMCRHTGGDPYSNEDWYITWFDDLVAKPMEA